MPQALKKHRPATRLCTVAGIMAMMGTGAVACQSRAYNSDANAMKGVPQGLIAKYVSDPSRPGVTKFEITQLDAKGAPVKTVSRYAIGGVGFSALQFVKDPDKKAPADSTANNATTAPASPGAAGEETAGREVLQEDTNLIGTPLMPKEDENYGFITNTPWDCAEAEQFAYDEVRSVKRHEKGQLCVVEIHTMGKPGDVSLILVPLDVASDGKLDERAVKESIAKKLRMDPAWGAAKIAVSLGVKMRPISAGHPVRPNEGLDVEGVATALYETYHQFKSDVNDKTRNTCLNNYSAVLTKWTDLQEHYWCQFPLAKLPAETGGQEGARTCYIKKLLSYKAADEAAGMSLTDPKLPFLAKAEGLRQYHQAAFDYCAKKGEGPLVWIAADPKRKAAFDYIMHSVTIVNDFNIESEQRAINEFYRRIAKPRARRVVDTFPTWLPEQPRYAEIIKLQALLRVAWPIKVEKPYREWLATNPKGPGVPGRVLDTSVDGAGSGN